MKPAEPRFEASARRQRLLRKFRTLTRRKARKLPFSGSQPDGVRPWFVTSGVGHFNVKRNHVGGILRTFAPDQGDRGWLMRFGVYFDLLVMVRWAASLAGYFPRLHELANVEKKF